MTYLTSIDLETDPSNVAEAGPQLSLLRLFSPGITDLWLPGPRGSLSFPKVATASSPYLHIELPSRSPSLRLLQGHPCLFNSWVTVLFLFPHL